jgi:hypothetical protein
MSVRAFDKDFLGIGSKHIQRFADELVEKHCLLRSLAIHEFCTLLYAPMVAPSQAP